jgi:hypothetical protein
MIDVTLSILALIAGGVTLELFAVAEAAKNGAETRGLAFESQVGPEEFQCGNPS